MSAQVFGVQFPLSSIQLCLPCQNPTVVLLNVVLFALLLCLLALLPIAWGYGGYLFLHVFLLIFLVALLLFLINW